MLGQIDFKPWQCLAELIDNSIDAFLDEQAQGFLAASPSITIDLPSDMDLRNGNGRLIIRDNGSGMTREQLGNAVRAGYSGNDPVEKMGLFGMGFNISTARLGRRTEVWTTTRDSLEWIGIVIDFDQHAAEGRGANFPTHVCIFRTRDMSEASIPGADDTARIGVDAKIVEFLRNQGHVTRFDVG